MRPKKRPKSVQARHRVTQSPALSPTRPQSPCREGRSPRQPLINVNAQGGASLAEPPLLPQIGPMQPRPTGERRREPAINLPSAIVAFVVVLVAIQAVREFLPEDTDLQLLLGGGFIPAQWSISFGRTTAQGVIAAAGLLGSDATETAMQIALARYVVGETVPHAWSWLSYALLHESWTHLVLNSAWFVAFGAPVARRIGAVRSTALAIVTAFGGALAHWFAAPLSAAPMIGASAVASGFMGAAATFVFVGQPAGAAYRPVAQPSALAFLTNRPTLIFLGIWFASNLLFAFIAKPLGLTDGAVAWQAHIGGLLAGVLVFPLIDPGPGWRERKPSAA